MNLVYIWYIFRLDLEYSLQEQLETLICTRQYRINTTRTHWWLYFIYCKYKQCGRQ